MFSLWTSDHGHGESDELNKIMASLEEEAVQGKKKLITEHSAYYLDLWLWLVLLKEVPVQCSLLP